MNSDLVEELSERFDVFINLYNFSKLSNNRDLMKKVLLKLLDAFTFEKVIDNELYNSFIDRFYYNLSQGKKLDEKTVYVRFLSNIETFKILYAGTHTTEESYKILKKLVVSVMGLLLVNNFELEKK